MKPWKTIAIVLLIGFVLYVGHYWINASKGNAYVKSGVWTEFYTADGTGTVFVRWNEDIQDYEFATPTPEHTADMNGFVMVILPE